MNPYLHYSTMPDLNAKPRSPWATGVKATCERYYHRGVALWVMEVRDWDLALNWLYGVVDAKYARSLWESWQKR
jgi:hypothetical protein